MSGTLLTLQVAQDAHVLTIRTREAGELIVVLRPEQLRWLERIASRRQRTHDEVLRWVLSHGQPGLGVDPQTFDRLVEATECTGAHPL